MKNTAALMLIPVLLLTALIPFASVQARSAPLGLPTLKGDAYFSGEGYHATTSNWQEWYWTLSSPAVGLLSAATTTGYVVYEWGNSTSTYVMLGGNILYSGGTFYTSPSYPAGWTGTVSVRFTSGTSYVNVAGALSSYCPSTSTKLIMVAGANIWNSEDYLTGGAMFIQMTGTYYKAVNDVWTPVGTATHNVVITSSLGNTWELEMSAYPYPPG